MSKPNRGKRIALLAGCVVVVVIAIVAWVCRDKLQAWYHFYQQFESLGENEQGYPEHRHRQTGIVFVSLPGGTFRMGSPERKRDNERPAHRVTLSPFLIAKYEVSQEEWIRAMDNNPSDIKSVNFPVETVSWEDCQRFCMKTSLKLPTEAQWEYACRAGKEGPYAGTGKLDEMGWYEENAVDGTHPVGEKEPNDFGVYDMHGNVWEWCVDTYDPNFYSRPGASWRDPVCQAASESWALRGGAWSYNAWACRSASRYGHPPWYEFDDLGFRPVWSSSP